MIVLVLGGTRSGKSEVAERLTAGLPAPITYLATAAVGDAEFATRIAAHRARRPAAWRTIEPPYNLVTCLRGFTGTALVDSIGTWLASTPGFAVDVGGLRDACTARDGDTVLVSEEVGLSVHPETRAGREFADALGTCNRQLADVADRVLLVVAGRVLELGARGV